MNSAILPVSRAKTWHAAILLLAAASGFIGIAHPLQNLNEGVYARVALEMIDSGRWIVPTLDGVPYLEKPPLLYWITALAFRLFGVSEWSARAAPWLGGILTLGAIAWLARRALGRTTSVTAVCIAASLPLTLVLSRTLLFDSLFAGLLACSLASLYAALHEPEARGAIRWSAAWLGCAVLAKGLAAPVFYAIIAAIAAQVVARERWRLLIRDPAAWAIFLAITVPWHVAASLREPGFAWFYFVNEHVMRFLDRRVPDDYQTGPWWYYFPRLVVDTFPWILLLATAPRRGDAELAPLRRFLWTWLLVPFAVFSLCGAKSDYYLAVAMPPVAILAAMRLRAARGRRALTVLPLAWLAMLSMAAVLATSDLGPWRMPAHATVLLAGGAALAAISALLMWTRRSVEGALVLAAVAIPAALIYSGFFVANEGRKSARSVAAELHALGPVPVYVYRDFEKVSALAFYHAPPLGIIDSESKDLWYGTHLRPYAIPMVSSRDETWRRARRVAIVASASQLQDLARTPLAGHVKRLASTGEFLVLVTTGR